MGGPAGYFLRRYLYKCAGRDLAVCQPLRRFCSRFTVPFTIIRHSWAGCDEARIAAARPGGRPLEQGPRPQYSLGRESMRGLRHIKTYISK
jgi:hypothetical protein